MLMTAVKWWARIDDDDARADDWRRVFGRLELPVFPQMQEGLLEGHEEPVQFYWLDMTRLSAGQVTALKQYLCERYAMEPDTVEAWIGCYGVPIVSENVTLMGRAS